MEHKVTVYQKAADLVSQYDHFFAAVKERATSFSGNAASVNYSIEADFEALHVMLEQRKNVLLAKVQEEVAATRESDTLLELEAKQRNLHYSLQQLQQLTVQGLLSEDNNCYQRLLTELSEAKQKLKETSDKFQIKYEAWLKPLANKIANYGEVVSGCGKRGDEQKSLPIVATKSSVDFAHVFATISDQFETRQLQATRKEMRSFPESPLKGWFEYSKKLQWRCPTTIPSGSSSQAAVPDYPSIFNMLKDNFTNRPVSTADHSVKVTNELYEKWLMPGLGERPNEAGSSEWLSSDEAVTKGFNSITTSDTSLWLCHSSSATDDNAEHHSHFIPETSSWLLRPPSIDKEEPLQQDYAEWLNPVKQVENYQTWLTAAGTQPIKQDDVTNWLHQGNSWSNHFNDGWLLLPKGGSTMCSETSSLLLPLGGDSGGDILSDAFGSTQTLTSFGSSDFEVVDDTDL